MSKKTSEEWQKLCKIEILDPDGWDRTADGWHYSWHEEKITREEFEKRLMMSTCRWNPDDLHNMWVDR